MIATYLKLWNWRNFKEIDIPLTERMFFVGPNASGKSNLLDVFRFLRDIAKSGGGLKTAVLKRGGISKIRCLAARRSPEIGIEIHLSSNKSQTPEWIYSIGIVQESRGNRQPWLKYEKVFKNGEMILSRPNTDDKMDKIRLYQTHLEQINSNAAFREVADFFESVDYLHLIPQLLKYPDRFSSNVNEDDPFGYSLLERIMNTTEKTRKSRLKRIEFALRSAVPQLKELSEVRDKKGIPHIEALYEHWRPNAGKQREDQFSDGTLRLISLLWSLLETHTILLLEEPEISLHNEIIKKIPQLIFRTYTKKKSKEQIFVSTHSAELLKDSGIGGEEVVLLIPKNEGTKVLVAKDDEKIKMLLDEGLNIADAVSHKIKPENLSQMNLFGK